MKSLSLWRLLPVFLFSCFFYNVNAQNTASVQINMANLFQQDYLTNQGHIYNANFVRERKIASFKIFDDKNAESLADGAQFTQYDFYENGQIQKETVYKKQNDDLKVIGKKEYIYDNEKLKTIKESFGGEFFSELVFVYSGENLTAVIEKTQDGATGNWSKYYWENGKMNKKISYVNNKIVQVEYYFPADKSLAKLTEMQEEEKRDVEGKSVFFYLYDNDKIVTELWFAFADDYVVTRGYNAEGQLENVTKAKRGESYTMNYRYDTQGNLLRIKETAPNQADKYHRYKYDDNQVFINEEILKTDTEVLERKIYRYEFWTDKEDSIRE